MNHDALETRLQVQGQVQLSKQGQVRWQTGHPWFFERDLQKAPRFGGIYEVQDATAHTLGFALASPQSKILIRMLHCHNAPPTLDSLRQLFHRAWGFRRQHLSHRQAYRVVHGEADGLPGLFIDRYHDAWVLQTTCEGAATLESLMIHLITQDASPKIIIRRNDTQSRRHEGLALTKDIVFGDKTSHDYRVMVREGDVSLTADLLEDQKTGSFLDQSENHLAARRYAHGRGLDICTYHGGFALQLAQKCERVTAVDLSKKALGAAQRGLPKPGSAPVDWVLADAFDYLPARLQAGERYDVITLDPPALASGADTTKKALRAYAKLNRAAFSLLEPGGILITCSCSGRISPEDFDQMLLNCSRKSQRPYQLIESRRAGPDHPVLAGVPETDYLKCRIIRVL
jgi:23S rRNA (cytosine1962-C5)-methyltransferase